MSVHVRKVPFSVYAQAGIRDAYFISILFLFARGGIQSAYYIFLVYLRYLFMLSRVKGGLDKLLPVKTCCMCELSVYSKLLHIQSCCLFKGPFQVAAYERLLRFIERLKRVKGPFRVLPIRS